MKFLFLDDSKVNKPKREKMGALVGVGGLIVDADQLSSIEKAIEKQCSQTHFFPAGEIFKWSPSRSDWFRENITGQKRSDFIKGVFEACAEGGAKVVVAINDQTKKTATNEASNHEMDVLTLALERFHTSLGSETGFVIAAKPSGGSKDENKFLAECIQRCVKGTDFVRFEKFAHNIVTAPTSHSRLLQASDLVVSVTTAMVSGNSEYAEQVFPYIEPLFLKDWRGLIGGTGLKIHPAFSYRNLYHWLLDDDCWADGSSGFPYPDKSRPYASHPNKY